MSTPRTPNPGAMCTLLIGGTLAVLVAAWLLANVLDSLYQIYEFLQGAW